MQKSLLLLVSALKRHKHIVKTTLAAVALLTAANPETKAQPGFSVNGGPYLLNPTDTFGNDTIIGSGTFNGALDATQGGVDTITVAGGSTITFGGATPNSAIIDAGLGTITVGAGSTLTAGVLQRGIYALSTATNPGNTQSTSITNEAQITSGSFCIFANISNNIATGSAAVTINNISNLNSTISIGIRATASGQASSTVNVQNSGVIISNFENILAEANANFGVGGDAFASIVNSGNLNSGGTEGIEANAVGATSATASVQNSGSITSNFQSIYSFANATIGVGGNATASVSNSGNLNSTSADGILALAQGIVSATASVQNSGDISSNDEGITAQADALFGSGGSAFASVSNSGNLNSGNDQGIEALAWGRTSANAFVQNSGNITAFLEAVRIQANTITPLATGDSLINFSNSGNLVSNTDNGVRLEANSRNNATISFNNSGSVLTNAGGAFYGIYAVADATTGTGGVATISGSNSGQVTASNVSDDAVRLEAAGNIGANISFSNSGNLTSLNNNGLAAIADTTPSTTDANANTIISNSGTIIAPANSGIEALAIANGDAFVSVSNSGDITAGNTGMVAYAQADADGNSVGTGSIKVTNTGTINAGNWGIYIFGLNLPEAEVYNLYGSITTSANHAIYIHPNVGVNRTWLVGGNISAGGMVFQGNGNSTLYVINNPQLNGGMMDGGNPGNTSQIKFKLVGMSPKEAKKAKAQMGNSAGSFSINGGKLQYNWQDFDGGSSGTFISLQTKVDKSLVPTAKWLDNNAYKFVDNADIGKFYLAAGDKPGEMIANLMGQAEALARNDVLLEYSNLIAHTAFNLGHDFAAGYAARSFDISMVNLYRPDVLMAGNAILNRLDRISDSPMRSPRKANTSNLTPWSFWIGGSALVASHEKWEDRAGYDNLTGNPMLGLNYRPSANTNIGLMGGATITDLDFTNGSSLEGSGALFALHGTQRFADFYTSAFVGGGVTGFEQQRRIMGRTARADFESSMVTTGGNVGYGFKLGNLTLAPEAGLVYTHLMHDGYRERGAGVFNRTVGSNEVDSLKTRLGGRLSYLVEMADWVFAPFVHASWAHELMYDNNEAPVKLPRFGMPSFDIGNDNPERNSALIGAGISGKVNKLSQLSWYVGYEANIGFSNYVSHTSSLGFRWDF